MLRVGIVNKAIDKLAAVRAARKLVFSLPAI